MLESLLESLVPCTGETWIDLYPEEAIFGNWFLIVLKDQSNACSITPSFVLDGSVVESAA